MTLNLEKQIKDFINQNPPPHGWCTEEKALAMAQLILEVKPSLVVEIGVFGGRSLVPQGMACKVNGKGKVVGIDAWEKSVAVEGVNSPENDKWWAELDMDYIYRHCFDNLWKNELREHCIIIRTASQHCVDLFGVIDILHIDGAHSEVASVRDVVNYLPKVRPGGFVWFDDVDWPTTKKAVETLRDFCDEIKTVSNCTLFRKR